jgi:hypothetical protein
MEGGRAIDQREVETQVVAEPSRSGGRGRSTRDKTGHNTRTCQIVIEISGEEYKLAISSN